VTRGQTDLKDKNSSQAPNGTNKKVRPLKVNKVQPSTFSNTDNTEDGNRGLTLDEIGGTSTNAWPLVFFKQPDVTKVSPKI